MTDKEIELHSKIAEMEGDIIAVVSTFKEVLSAFGITPDDFSNTDAASIAMKLPGIVGKLTTELMTGGFNGAAFASLKSLQPVLEKYKHLIDLPKNE